MKKIIKIVSVILAVASVCILFTSCAKKTEDKLEYEIKDDGTVEIVSYTDLTTRTEITVPDEIEGKPVVKICNFSMFNAESLEKITIGKNVREIGEWAFTNNQGLREYAVNPENEYFTAVDGVLFTKDMKTIVYYPPAKNIKFDKFKANLNTTTYEIPDGVETIRSKAFYKCYYITDIKIPDSVKRIEEKAFHKATALEKVTLPENLEFIGKDSFAYCEKITELTVPASVTEIDEYAFYNCKSMKKVTMFPKEAEMTLGKKWFPTDNGRTINDLALEWK